LNFRNPNNITGNDLEVDAGQVQSLEATSGTQVLASSALVEGTFGTIGTAPGDVSVGFSAIAANGADTDGQIWLTRYYSPVDQAADHAPTVANSKYASPGALVQATQNEMAVNVADIALGYGSGTPVVGYNNTAVVTGGTSGNSYQAQAEQNSGSGTGTINYATESLTASKGGDIEQIQSGAGNVYEALWDIPASDAGEGPPVYEGYLTFQTDGEVDFTSSVPEPSTYTLLLSTGLGAWALRRKKRA